MSGTIEQVDLSAEPAAMEDMVDVDNVGDGFSDTVSFRRF